MSTASYRPGLPLCERTGKIGYRSQAKARQEARSIRDRPNPDTARKAVGRRLRVYECPHCGYWHLTSRPDQPREETS